MASYPIRVSKLQIQCALSTIMESEYLALLRQSMCDLIPLWEFLKEIVFPKENIHHQCLANLNSLFSDIYIME